MKAMHSPCRKRSERVRRRSGLSWGAGDRTQVYTARMPIVVRTVTPAEFPKAIETFCAAFTMHLPDDLLRRKQLLSSPDRTLAAFDGDVMLGTATFFPFDLTVPGGTTIPIGGVADAGVLPTARRRGVFRLIMESQLRSLRDHGLVAAMLHPTEDTLYGRYGYGAATLEAKISVDTTNVEFIGHAPDGRLELVSAHEARQLLPALHDRYRLMQPGDVSRSPAWWDDHVTEYAYRTDRPNALFHLFYTSPSGSLDGYAAFRPSSNRFPESMTAEGVFATTGEAEQAIWRHLLARDLIGRVDIDPAPVDGLLRWLVADRHSVATTTHDQNWLRLLDVRAAMESRSYACDGRLAVRVSDPLFSENDGTFTLEVAGGHAVCRRTEDVPPDVDIDIADLASLYLGGVTLSVLVRAGRTTASDGTVQLADDMFSTQRAPFASLFF